MRSFVAAATLIAGVTAHMHAASDIVKCADDALAGIDASSLEACADKSTLECYCSNPDALSGLSDAAEESCNAAGIDFSTLSDSLCGSSREAAPARHASNPMMPANNMLHMSSERAYSPSSPEVSEPRVVYVTETKTECGCRATPAPFDPMHLSQIPVNVPASSSMAPMGSASTPYYSHGVLVGASSASSVFGSMATPAPSGASGQRFNAFEGAAPKASVQGGVAALGFAAVMGLMMAL